MAPEIIDLEVTVGCSGKLARNMFVQCHRVLSELVEKLKKIVILKRWISTKVQHFCKTRH